MNCNNNQNNNNGCGCNCNPHPTPTPEPVDINMSVCDRNINMLPMLQTYTTKVLKPNIEGCCKKNILTQQMMNCENYKYVIKWDFDLNGETITVPENCILEFDGGSLKNGTIIGQDTLFINVGDVDIWGENLTREGIWKEKQRGIPDKEYNPSWYSGLGRKTLELKGGSNILTQEDFNQENTIYIISYDFDLDGQEVSIPDGCILEFDGGSVANGTIVGQNTQIKAEEKLIFNNVDIAGTWNVHTVYVDWFNVSEVVGYDNTPILENVFNLTDKNLQNTVIFPDKTLYVSAHTTYSPIERLYIMRVKSNTKVVMNSHIFVNTYDKPHYQVFQVFEAKNVIICGSGIITGDSETHIVTPDVSDEHGMAIEIGSSQNVTIQGLTLEKCWGDGIEIGCPDTYTIVDHNDTTHYPKEILIENIICDDNRRNNISVLECDGVEIRGCRLKNAGKTRGTSPRVGIDVEPWLQNGCSKNVFIHDNVFSGNTSGDITIAGYGVGVERNNWAYNVTLKGNTNPSNLVLSIVGGSYISVYDQIIGKYNISCGDNISFNDCKFVAYGEYLGGLTSFLTEVEFNSCKFIQEAEQTKNAFFYFNSYTYKWKARFNNCLFKTSLEGVQVSSGTLGSIEEYNNCTFEMPNSPVTIHGIASLKNCILNTSYVILVFGQKEENYIISNNILNTTADGSCIKIRESPDLTGDFDKDVIINDNICNGGDGFINYIEGFRQSVMATLGGVIANNKHIGNMRLASCAYVFPGAKIFINDNMGYNIDPNPIAGELAYTYPIWIHYDGTRWVNPMGEPLP